MFELDMIDTHCHLDMEPLYSNLAAVIDEARSVGVTRFVVPGVNPENWDSIAAIAREYPESMPAFGVHPMFSAVASDAIFERLQNLLTCSTAVGEIGLDPACSISMVTQEKVFREQLKLAFSAGLPVLVHCRKAFEHTLRIMREEKITQVGGIMHAFSGSVEMAREFIKIGFAISVSAVVTKTGAVRYHRLVHELPLEHIVVETDAPDLPPECHRGEPNRPAWLLETVKKIAGLKGISKQAVAKACAENSLKILRKN